MSSDLREYNEHYNATASLWFGKHKNKPIREIPVDYLVWLRYGENDMYKKISKRLRGVIVGCIPKEKRVYKKDEIKNVLPKNELQCGNGQNIA